MGKIIGCLIGIIIVIALGAIEALVFQFLWNWLMPMLWTNCPIFTFWEAWGLMILINLISSAFK